MEGAKGMSPKNDPTGTIGPSPERKPLSQSQEARLANLTGFNVKDLVGISLAEIVLFVLNLYGGVVCPYLW
jgi:hypothetical protein